MSGDRGWSRREFLKGAGAVVGLPFFPSLHAGAAWADAVTVPSRLMFMAVPLGFVPNSWVLELQPEYKPFDKEGWFPEAAGPAYEMPAVHAPLLPHRQHISFLRGLSNHRYRGDAHSADDTWLTAAEAFIDPSRSYTNTISCDQLAAASVSLGGANVRYPSLSLGIPPTTGSTTGGLSWDSSGVPIGALSSPALVFDRLFGKDDLTLAERLQRLQLKKSILDVMLGQIGDLDRSLNTADRRKLDETLSAVRGVEAEIQRDRRWFDVPKPAAPFARPDFPWGEGLWTSSQHTRLMFALCHAAFVTDSTRVITCELPSVYSDVTAFDKHALNHGSSPEMHRDALKLDTEFSRQIAGLIAALTGSKGPDDQPLIHHTLAAFGAGVWGMNHCTRCLPLMLIGQGGGRIKQGASRIYDTSTPLANLWLTMLQVVGVKAGSFGDSTGLLYDLL
jgi:hypothetical protein